MSRRAWVLVWLLPVLGPACASEEPAAAEQAGAAEQAAPEPAAPAARAAAPERAAPREPFAPPRPAAPPEPEAGLAPSPTRPVPPPEVEAGPEVEAAPEVAFPPVPAAPEPGPSEVPPRAPVPGPRLQPIPAPPRGPAPDLGGAEVQSAAQAISLAVGDTDIRVAAQMVAELAGVQLELHPWVQGRVSLHLAQVPWRNALESLLAQAGEFELVGQGGLLVVVPRPMVFTGQVVAVEGQVLRVETQASVVELHLATGGTGLEAWREEALRHLLSGLGPGQRVSATAALRGEQLVLLSAAAAVPNAPGDR